MIDDKASLAALIREGETLCGAELKRLEKMGRADDFSSMSPEWQTKYVQAVASSLTMAISCMPAVQRALGSLSTFNSDVERFQAVRRHVFAIFAMEPIEAPVPAPTPADKVN